MTRPAAELALVRQIAHARLAHGAEVAAARDRLREATPALTIYCERDRGGRRTKLAEAALLDDGTILFVSRIEWVPSDLLTLRPWEREAYLGAVWNERLGEDDRMLSNWLDHLDGWEAGVRPTGERWLKRPGGPFGISVVLTPGVEPVLTPWIRCPNHPNDAEVVNVADLMSAWRTD